jgi:hypothetical protein
MMHVYGRGGDPIVGFDDVLQHVSLDQPELYRIYYRLF